MERTLLVERTALRKVWEGGVCLQTRSDGGGNECVECRARYEAHLIFPEGRAPGQCHDHGHY